MQVPLLNTKFTRAYEPTPAPPREGMHSHSASLSEDALSNEKSSNAGEKKLNAVVIHPLLGGAK